MAYQALSSVQLILEKMPCTWKPAETEQCLYDLEPIGLRQGKYHGSFLKPEADQAQWRWEAAVAST